MKKITVIAPHADDEILGLGGYLVHELQNGSEVSIIVVAMNEGRVKEFEKAVEVLEVKNAVILFPDKDSEMDTVPKKNIIKKFEVLIEDIKPDELFLPYPSQHQDHEVVYKCGIAAIRMKPGYVVPKVMLYEYPLIGGHFDYIYGGKYYHKVDDVIEKKITLFESCYTSQIKKFPSPINREGIRGLARIRGMECGVKYAEMFYLQRVIE